MGIRNTVASITSAIESALAMGFKAAGTALGIGFVLLLIGAPTYNNVTAGDYTEAAIGGVILLAATAGVLWWLSGRIDLDGLVPSGSSASGD